MVSAADYDAAYFGADPERPPKANYRNYTKDSQPHWSGPLARLLARHVSPPVLDMGCGFGHLIRDLEYLGVGAVGIDWSPYATAHAVSPNVLRGDARDLVMLLRGQQFGAVVSMDFLEHLLPEDGISVMAQMVAVLRPGGSMVHLIGAHNPEEDLARHLEDPTHINHFDLNWYREQFDALGMVYDPALTETVASERAWRTTDWRGRFLVLRDGRNHG